ncbi:unnamed protein product, partial [Rotaria magnacalcarata]
MNSSNDAQTIVYTLLQRLERETELYDLHTHLLGMGNIGFWINTILMNQTVLPTNKEFENYHDLRKNVCRLVWDKNKKEFIYGEKVDELVQYLMKESYPNGSLERLKKNINALLPGTSTVFNDMHAEDYKLIRELRHYGLTFKNFSYDVILKLEDLVDGLGIKNTNKDIHQAAIEEKLGFHTCASSHRPSFRYWVIFNARLQHFEIVYGITVEELRKLIDIDANAPREANKLARAHIVNAFSMCDAQGTLARPVDFHGFHGMFTPEFYPRRFALKDSIYSQRLDVLAHLLYYVLHRYDICSPPVTYCEFSVGVGDLTREWVLDVLCSLSTSARRSTQSSRTNSLTPRNNFRKLLCDGYFPALQNAVNKNAEDEHQSMACVSKCVYKFLAGFRRQSIQTDLFKNQAEAIDLLNEAPHMAIHLMLKEIKRSSDGEPTNKDGCFYPFVNDLEKMPQPEDKNSAFHDWVVGFDLFGDEMGFPYCPFVAPEFINYVVKRRSCNTSFGLRIHCGENVPFADVDSSAYRHFAAHMYIVFRCLRYLQAKLEYGIRIGHGIAFQRILDGSMKNSKHRKSSVLLAEIQSHARHVFKTIAFEVNITSNEYLLGHALRRGDFQQALQLEALLNVGVPIILATDDDGIWPIDKCTKDCSGHHSLSGEFCRAISSQIINSKQMLEKIFEDMKNFPFYTEKNECCMPKSDSILFYDVREFPVIIHPDIVKYIMMRCTDNQLTGKFCDDFSKIHPLHDDYDTNSGPPLDEKEKNELEKWEKTCSRLAPIAYVSHCAEKSEINPKLNEDMRYQYSIIFKDFPKLDNVLADWKSVYQQLIEPNI